uniref:ATP-dependent RNA helicase n=1 Tax=Denticeps clupeoides TaxID=299321 RepID=A0AAY4ELG6_9TELE
MADDLLCINISSSAAFFGSRLSSRDGRAAKAGKRRADGGIREVPGAKRRRTPGVLGPQKNTTPSPAGEGRQQRSAVGKSHVRTTDRHRDGQRGPDRPFIKTSSLFRNNPDVPDIHSPAVTQVKEKVFTSDSFEALDLHPHLLATLDKVLHVTSMTSVQRQTIPVLMAGKDAVVRSQTGSGKTLAYGVPVVQSLQAADPKIKRSDGPLAVIMVPTRELAKQTFEIFQKLLKPFTWIVPGVLMGGEKRKAEKARLRKGINILISTPGRLVDHIKNTLSIAFSAVRWLILDEADRILDLGFEKDLTVILNAINANGPSRQNVLLSATLTEGLSRLASISMKDPVSIQVSEIPEESRATLSKITVAKAEDGQQADSFAVPENLQQHAVVVPSKLRLVCLAAFILSKCKFDKGQKLIVFVSSCEVVEFLCTLFTTVLCGQRDASTTLKHHSALNFLRLHGNMKQEDVAARGLDLPQVTWIVQYNPPCSVAEYVHRVGRTARIGTRGCSLLFLTPSEVAYMDVLASHSISIFFSFPITLQKSAQALEQELRERATVLQSDFENVVHASEDSVQTAKKALQSFLRAYTTYPSSAKHIFHIRSLHLGHAAKSFGLRDAPQGLVTKATKRPGAKDKTKNKEKRYSEQFAYFFFVHSSCEYLKEQENHRTPVTTSRSR